MGSCAVWFFTLASCQNDCDAAPFELLADLRFAAFGGQVLFALHQILGRNPAALRFGLVGQHVLALVAVLSRLVALNRRQQLLLGDLNAWVLVLGIKDGELLLEVDQPGGAIVLGALPLHHRLRRGREGIATLCLDDQATNAHARKRVHQFGLGLNLAVLGHGQRSDDFVQCGWATLGRNGEGQQQGGIVVVNGVHGEPLQS